MILKYPESKRLAQLFAQEKPHQLGNEERDDSIPQKALIPSIATQSHEPNRGIIETTTKTKHKKSTNKKSNLLLPKQLY